MHSYIADIVPDPEAGTESLNKKNKFLIARQKVYAEEEQYKKPEIILETQM